MPALEQKVVADLTERLCAYLASLGGYGAPQYLTAGGSAAVFKVDSAYGPRAFKAFNPDLFSGTGGDADRRRLDVQRRLIGHSCRSLVDTYRVEEAHGTAFMEMEFIPWPQLTAVLPTVPDGAVVQLFTQLVTAVKFLDDNNVVHRDIKPENIHVSSDYVSLKLLDLGVARELEHADVEEAAVTDQGNLRPFLATAQYSSPEYLFRLDEPSMKLWKGLNFYQLGAVLHDLIMKEPLFLHEMKLGNRWLVARAVLTKIPSFADSNPARLASLKALAARCLVKDLDARLQLVGWEDFILEGAKDPLTALRARLAKGTLNAGGQSNAAAASRLEFDRNEFARRFADRVRAELLPSCGTSLPLSVKPSAPGEYPYIKFLLTVDKRTTIDCLVRFDWQEQLYERTTNIQLSGRILCVGYDEAIGQPSFKLVATATIAENEDESAAITASAIAAVAAAALNRIESADDVANLHGVDLQAEADKEKGA
jgi:serine/threonine protein kinase